jgi:hypothetical protein
MADRSSENRSPLSIKSDGEWVAIRLTPKASANRVSGIMSEADGGARIKVSVTAVPENGRANAALIKLLARQWKTAKSNISIIRGLTGRRKTVLVSGDPKQLSIRLQAWLKTLATND